MHPVASSFNMVVTDEILKIYFLECDTAYVEVLGFEGEQFLVL